MATYDLDEQEQLDELKAWWKRWGNLVTFGLSAVLIAVAGWQYWQHHSTKQVAEAAGIYDGMSQAVEAGDMKAVKEQGALLTDKYGSTPKIVGRL